MSSAPDVPEPTLEIMLGAALTGAAVLAAIVGIALLMFSRTHAKTKSCLGCFATIAVMSVLIPAAGLIATVLGVK
ncbi:hypothetical protein MHY20_08955 [Helcobacillus sp. ACRRO]|uniref:hypothetical protein n=1 Tax=Helcobacillus TaxID=1161125 RepID=UPI001EF60EB7|nr:MULTISPECIES: hypothetical protein [Helcobacillus]MCG7427731.1 hypothetical protein [Helcobacillus sp. ACRRO]MDK7742901.1 hypothetical protein [Helcobacillus massiliensis]WOO93562.1 hypothetical protein R3I40_02935 [Helcobacillus massiliensis]